MAEMTRSELEGIVVAARREAHGERQAGRPDDGAARAWERLADAADCLHALLVRHEALYEDPIEPGYAVAVVRDD